MGRQGIDNGFIIFNQVRIARENMLSRWSQVSRDGEYTAPPKKQLSYGALISGRVTIIAQSSIGIFFRILFYFLKFIYFFILFYYFFIILFFFSCRERFNNCNKVQNFFKFF